MKILKFSLQKNNEIKTFDFSSVNLITSDVNSTGKTTFLKSILYSLGFNMPDSQEIKYSEYLFSIVIETNNGLINVVRNNNHLSIEDKQFSLPSEETNVIAEIFKIDNNDVYSNLLNCIFMDQDAGWNIINIGTIAGGYRFSLPKLLEGLNNFDDQGLRKRVAFIDEEIERYNLLIKVMDKRKEYLKTNNSLFVSSDKNELEKDSYIFKSKLNEINKKISEINRTIETNARFGSFLNQMKLSVKNPDPQGKPIPVNENTLCYMPDNMSILKERLYVLKHERNIIISKLDEIVKKQNNINEFNSINEIAGNFFNNIDIIDPVKITSAINELKAEKSRCENALKEFMNNTNIWVYKFWEIAKKYGEILKVPLYLYENTKLIYMKRKRNISGAILHKLSLSFRLASLKVLEEKYGYNLPLFIDSPGGREIVQETIDKSISLICDEFKSNQIFIASINDYSHNISSDKKIIRTDKKIFDFDSQDNVLTV